MQKIECFRSKLKRRNILVRITSKSSNDFSSMEGDCRLPNFKIVVRNDLWARFFQRSWCETAKILITKGLPKTRPTNWLHMHKPENLSS